MEPTKAGSLSPLKFCDVVMKGGITSGVVYPPAILELAQDYQFKSIGGASAGAIAAAATAAAEYGRQRSTGGGFQEFGKLPDEFKKPGFLLNLFTPDHDTGSGFRVALRIMQATSIPGRIMAGLWAILSNFLGGTALGLMLSLLVIGLATWAGNFTHTTGRQTTVLLLIAVCSTFIVTFVTALTTAVIQTARGLAANNYGFCKGMGEPSGPPALTKWMYTTFNKLAGLPETEPLTFQHLWTADGSNGIPRAINLEVITTNLTHLSPYTIPFREHTFYFDPAEWAELFPQPVLEWLLAHPAQLAHTAFSKTGTKLIPLPDPGDLPVVVAARLSLSFPGLVSAMPLYAVDFSLKRNKDHPPTVEAERCWFSDGGICSNFPVHFFDAPIPRWPTFAINLREPHPEYDTDGSSFVYFPSSCREGPLASWRRFNPTGNGFADLGKFVAAILNTMKDWRDNLQTRMPGYRNRIVHISLKPNEGGLNIIMPPELIATLTTKGRAAGIALREEFNFPQHVWTRFRTTMSMLDSYLYDFAIDYNNPSPDAKHVWDLMNGQSADKPDCYPWKDEAERVVAVAATKEIANIGSAWTQTKHPLQDGAPHPKPQLRPAPPY